MFFTICHKWYISILSFFGINRVDNLQNESPWGGYPANFEEKSGESQDEYDVEAQYENEDDTVQMQNEIGIALLLLSILALLQHVWKFCLSRNRTQLVMIIVTKF